MERDSRIWVVTADLGYGMFDKISTSFPDRFVNCGASEQLMVGMGVGLALAGKIPVLYSITPFLLWRPAEWHRLYLNHERVPVKLVGSGRGTDYAHDGITHDATDDAAFLDILPNIATFWPETVDELPAVTEQWLYNERAAYLNLKR